MERLYKFLSPKMRKMTELIIMFIVSILVNIISENTTGSFSGFGGIMTDISRTTIVFLWSLSIGLMLVWLLYGIASRVSLHTSFSSDFIDRMKSHTDEALRGMLDSPVALGWGQDATIVCAPNIIRGWRPQDISFEFDSLPYETPERYRYLLKDFALTDEAKHMAHFGNNLQRVMLEAMPTADNHGGLHLRLKRTDWLHCRAFWSVMKSDKGKDLLKACVSSVTGDGVVISPNSFCLHLIIVSSDDQVIVTGISKDKTSDYPTRKAVTIGEQLDIEDITDGRNLHPDFIRRWTKRAMQEEFGITDIQYKHIVDERSLRLLSVNLEGDICNFSLAAVLRLKCDVAALKREVDNSVEISEISKLEGIPIEAVPSVLSNFSEEDIYHPSSSLRFLMAYVNHVGRNHAPRAF